MKILADNGLEHGRYAMFAAARVDPTKGCLTLIEAWRRLGCPAPLLVVGDLWHARGHEEELRAAAQGMDVRFLPRIDGREVLAGLVAAADVFVFPSSMMLLEVMSLSVPILSSDIAANTDVLPDAAWTFVAGDPDDLARAYRDLKAEPEGDVRARCLRRAESTRLDYSWDRIRQMYESVYRGVLGMDDDHFEMRGSAR